MWCGYCRIRGWYKQSGSWMQQCWYYPQYTNSPNVAMICLLIPAKSAKILTPLHAARKAL